MAEVTELQFQTASNGTYYVENTTANAINFAGIWVAEDNTAIDVVLGTDGTNITANMGLGAGVLLPKGMLITHGGDYMTSITLSAGAVQLIRG